MKSMLMTGAAGRIGTFLRPELAGKYRLRLSDIKPIRDLRPGETFMRADVSRLSDMLRVTKGVDAVVHFGGQSGEHDWDRILSANIIGFYNALEAARRNGVKRFLVATSNHAVGFYRCDQTIDHRVYPRPDSRYGVSKVFNEALASLYADRYGMQMFCMRIGNYQGGGHCMAEGGTRSRLAGEVDLVSASPKARRAGSRSKSVARKAHRDSTRKRLRRR